MDIDNKLNEILQQIEGDEDISWDEIQEFILHHQLSNDEIEYLKNCISSIIEKLEYRKFMLTEKILQHNITAEAYSKYINRTMN